MRRIVGLDSSSRLAPTRGDRGPLFPPIGARIDCSRSGALLLAHGEGIPIAIEYSTNLWRVLTCPQCRHASLSPASSGARCDACALDYPASSRGQLDLRLQRPRGYQLEIELGQPLPDDSEVSFSPLAHHPRPAVDFTRIVPPRHLSSQMLSHFPRARSGSSMALDMGCGDGSHRGVCEHAGFEYVGLDYETDEAMLFGDAHALPFKDESFEFILSVAVLEHIRHPVIMMRELHRVLKPGGVFIGTVAFLEPFHANSFYHHTHLGTLNSLAEGGFQAVAVAPSATWTVLTAQSKLLFPKVPRKLSKSLVWPVDLLHRLWWKVGGWINSDATEDLRVRTTTGSFAFVAKRPNVEQASSTAEASVRAAGQP